MLDIHDRYEEEIRKQAEDNHRLRDEKIPALIKYGYDSISSTLLSMGFDVKDISHESKFIFKIIAKSQFYSFIADIKMKRLTRPIPLDILRVESYNNYNTSLDKLIIFKSRGKNDDRLEHKDKMYPDCFILTLDIPRICYTVGPYYVIEHCHTTPLAALRKIIEKNYSIH